MSNPARQINNRRLPPLPGLGRRGTSPQTQRKSGGTNRHYGGATSPRDRYNNSYSSQQYDMVIQGHNTIGSASHHHNNNKSNHSTTSTDALCPFDLTPDAVTSFLNDNPEFLEKYVVRNVNSDQLERWIIKRTQNANKENGKRRGSDVENGINGESELRDGSGLLRWKMGHHPDKRKILQELTKDIHQHPNKAQVLSELTNCVASAINADGFNLYLVDENGRDLYYFKPNSNNTKNSTVWSGRIGNGGTLGAYIAETQEALRLTEVLGDERFPDGIAVGGETAQAVLAQPIIQTNSATLGVVELYRNAGNQQFTDEDEEICNSILVWGAFGIYNAEMYHGMTKQRKLNEFLLAVTKSIFQDIVSMDTVIMKIMNFAQKLVNADRASLFLVDNQTKELYARIFDIGNGLGAQPVDGQQKEIRFPMDKGIAGHVATTGNTLNISDAYGDDRFNRDVDAQTGYTTKTILCMPIYIRGSQKKYNIIGVVQMVNKTHGVFTKSDEESFETFAVYCGLALHHAKLYDKIRRSEQKHKVALEVLSYHSQCTEDEFSQYKDRVIPTTLPDVTLYEFSPWGVLNEDKPQYVLYMFKDIFNMSRFDISSLIKFTLTVRKNYRNVPYHNWSHAFSVAHAMYTVIKTTDNIFNPLERLALFVACLCHDVDHRGYTNAFMVKTASPLAAIYSTSTMEQHHFNHTISILQRDGHNIFKHLTSDEYKKVLSDIKHCILATDLALFFPNRAKLKDLCEKKEFSWEAQDHRRLIQAIAMTASDLCASTKPWQVQVSTVKVIFEEFYAQGDEEKAQGNQPIPMMDRDKAHELPQSQVGFIVGICLPCYELLANLLPGTQPMVDGANTNLKQWKVLVDEQKQKEEEKLKKETENGAKAIENKKD
ncbi:unnamed protein product [Owenia fusiformis]|uniref:Phosphodiesterase n=1 Tax=Owenia fusiformis TaxID=6347 RepID=A0A8J1Y200_OWEFU|nr:unnamed protein product [Owenia fusiformis]